MFHYDNRGHSLLVSAVFCNARAMCCNMISFPEPNDVLGRKLHAVNLLNTDSLPHVEGQRALFQCSLLSCVGTRISAAMKKRSNHRCIALLTCENMHMERTGLVNFPLQFTSNSDDLPGWAGSHSVYTQWHWQHMPFLACWAVLYESRPEIWWYQLCTKQLLSFVKWRWMFNERAAEGWDVILCLGPRGHGKWGN